MILAIRYSVKGVKKAHKSYKKHQAEKEQRLLSDRGQLPDLQDPSRELDTSCLVDLTETKSSSALSRTSSKSSASTASAEKALENDPSFKEYMEKQKALYLTHHRSRSQHANPPSYNSIMQQQSPQSSVHSPTSATATLSPTSSTTGHCSCHDCVRTMSSSTPLPRPVTPLPSLPELPPSTNVPVIQVQQEAKISELANSHRQPVEIMSQEDDAGDIIFELPGNMPAILPLKKPEKPVELPSEPA